MASSEEGFFEVPTDLSRFLAQRGVRDSTLRTFQENSIGKDVFLKMTRWDLKDLLPDDFLERKKVWDIITDLQQCAYRAEKPGKPLHGGALNPIALDQQLAPATMVNDPNNRSPSTGSTLSVSSSEEFSDHDRPRLGGSRPVSPASSCSSTPSWTHENCTLPPSSKGWESFKLPDPPGFKRGMEDLPEPIRKQIIRDAYTCMRARCEGTKMCSIDFKMVAQIICKKFPQMRDKEPPTFFKGVEFPYWGTVQYMLKRRHSNLKSKSSCGDSKKRSKLEMEASPQDVEKHYKEMIKELKRRTRNQEAVDKLQALTFDSRNDDIWENFRGPNVVQRIVKKYPFLENEDQLIYELKLHVQECLCGPDLQSTDFPSFMDNFLKLVPCLCGDVESSDEDKPAVAVQELHKFFDCPSVVTFIEAQDEIDDAIKKTVRSNAPQFVVFDPVEEESIDGQMFVVVDKQVFIESSPGTNLDYAKWLIVLLAVYFTFNLQYDDSQKLMFAFLEEFVLGLKSTRKSLRYNKCCNNIFSRK